MIKLKHFFNPILCRNLINPQLIRYGFTRRSQASQLILHSPHQIEKLHQKTKKKSDQQWETIRQSSDLRNFRVSLIGLPNSGKSSLFNCLAGQRLAIVDKLQGMTRDRRQFTILDGLVTVIDTPGVQVSAMGKNQANQLKADIFKQTVTALHESDMIFIVTDSRNPISADEIQLIKYVRTFNKHVTIGLACSKCDGYGYDEDTVRNQVKKLGIKDVFLCSGQEGTGIFQILDFIQENIPQQLRYDLQTRKQERIRKFQEVVKKLKEEIEQIQKTGFNIKQWESDFRKINSDPEYNEDLDYENYEDFLLRPEESFSNRRGKFIKNLRMKNSIKICFIGRPNVGKSSLINQILGEQRLVVSDVPHTTRDSIITKILYKQRRIQLIDTAGLNTPNFDENEEYLKKVQVSTMLHVKQSHVVIYVMDAFSAFKIDDFKLIRSVIKQGRPVIIAVNKWQAIKQQFKYKAINYLKKQIDKNLGELHGYPLIFVSAKMGSNLNQLMDNIILTYDKWNSRISTALINNWLEKFKKLDNLPKDKEMTLKINYIIQAKVRPPHFIFFVNTKSLFKDNYLRFVSENLAKQFEMGGIPVRISLRSTNNKENKFKGKRKQRKISSIKEKMEDLKKKYDNFGL